MKKQAYKLSQMEILKNFKGNFYFLVVDLDGLD